MLLGFRSNKTWKKVISVIYLVFCGFTAVGTFLSGRMGLVTTHDFLIDKAYGAIVLLGLISPYIFLSNTSFRDKLPFFKKHKVSSSALGLIIVLCGLLMISGIVNGFHSDEYLADMESHAYQEVSHTEASCEESGIVEYVCDYCGMTDREKIAALGHDMREISHMDPTHDADGKIVKECTRCGEQEVVTVDRLPKPTATASPEETTSSEETTIPDATTEPVETIEKPIKTEPATETTGYVSGETIQGTVSDIEDDGICEKLVSFGFTEDEAVSVREILLKCGITDIASAKATDPSATIDGLIAFRWEMDNQRTVWFTVDNREVLYIGLNGVDVYDRNNGGFLIDVNDVHIPESHVSLDVRYTLIDQTESVLDGYFINAQWYDAWGVGRSDDTYMVQCEVYAKNKLGSKDWIIAKVWYEYDGSEYTVTAVVIDGKRYK